MSLIPVNKVLSYSKKTKNATLHINSTSYI